MSNSEYLKRQADQHRIEYSDEVSEQELRLLIIQSEEKLSKRGDTITSCYGHYDPEDPTCENHEIENKEMFSCCISESKARDELDVDYLSDSEESGNINVKEEKEMAERTRRRRRNKADEVEEQEVLETEEEETEEEVAEETELEVDEAEVDEVEKPKKVRKQREKKLAFAHNCPEFIMHIRTTDDAIEAIGTRQERIGKDNHEIGHVLLHIKENKLFKPRFKSFTQFCQSQEVGYSVAQAANLINVVKKFDSDQIKAHGITKLLPITRLKEDADVDEVMDQLESGELTDVKAVEKAVKEKKSYPHTPSKTTDGAKAKAKIKEKKGLASKVGKTKKFYMTDDDGTELKNSKAVKGAKDPALYLDLADGVGIEIRTTDGVLWVAKFVPSE